MRFGLMGMTLTLVFAIEALAPTTIAAQENEGRGSRVITVTRFDVPFKYRSTLIPWMQEYFFPFTQLNPKIRNFRVLFHHFGSDPSQIVILAEYDDLADIEAECGAPCKEYMEAHPHPEKGDEGYEEFQAAFDLFSKHYGKHQDDIYTAPLEFAIVEREPQGTIGPKPDNEEDGGM